ncbi:MAG: SDR family oxidoreductase [Chloroflexi bacterium]|nr:SDR family oxidoreductase [Chloroflexota bacterium]
MQLDGKAALITGGTSGIGAATALELARGGADVCITGRRDTLAAQDVLAQVRAMGRRGELVPGDMSLAEDCRQAVAETVARLGRLDVLVHSAGGGSGGALEDVAFAQWRYAFSVHVDALYHLCREAIPHLRAQGEGAIVTISSVAGIRGVPKSVTYCTVKGAVLEFTRALARDLAEDNIRVNTVCPGIIRTPFHAAMTEEAKRHNLANRIPLHREGTADDVAQAIRLLVTNEFITGESLVIDGGMTSRVP